VADCSDHGNEHLGSIKGEEFLEKLTDCQLLMEDCSMELVIQSLCLSTTP
jgi:hypothetical protein